MTVAHRTTSGANGWDRKALHLTRRACIAVAMASSAGAGPARADDGEPSQSDSILAGLIQQSLAVRPEAARAEAEVRANEQRISRSRSLPDPMLQVGIQNDGFRRIEIGRTETSYLSVMASQTFPWPGKLAIQGDIAELDAHASKFGITRVRLSTEAEVRRAYLDLLLARDKLALLNQLRAVWQQAAAVTKILYQAGGGSQSDVLRAELELVRLRQRSLALELEERLRVQALNRLRARPLDEPIQTAAHVRDLPATETLAAGLVEQGALARSPELGAARVIVRRSSRDTALAEKGYYPDFTVGAGIMYRGAMPPMWQLTLGAPIPVFAGTKQSRAVAETRERTKAAENAVLALEQLVRLRSHERQTAFLIARSNIGIYEQGLLVQSEATAQSALAQYKTGKLSFASVLEANAGYLADQEAYLDAIAEAQRIFIAALEVSLDATSVVVPSGGTGTSMRASAPAAMPSNASAAVGAQAPAGSSSSGM